MKRLIIFCIILSCILTVNAQTIHWLTFIDTTDKNVGALDVTGREVLYSRFINVINAALAEKGYNSDVQDFYGNRTNPENCKLAIENLTCRPNDIIVFYYIGHGTHAMGENNNYPQMLLGCDWDEEHKFIPLAWVHDELKKKGSRLAITIGMCCNTIQGATAKKAPTFSVNYGNTYISPTELNAIQNLFLSNKGDFILSSASVNQSSVGGSTPLGDMDLFTAVLIGQFEKNAIEGNLSWSSLFNNVKNIVHNVTNGSQTPIFESNISPVQMTEVRREKPDNNTLDVRDANSVGNVLTQCTDYIIDKNQAIEKRIEVSDRLKKIFSPDAEVKILGQDGNIVVDKENINDFLGRISSSRILLKVVPTAYSYKGNYITLLKVKEYYKE